MIKSPCKTCKKRYNNKEKCVHTCEKIKAIQHKELENKKHTIYPDANPMEEQGNITHNYKTLVG